MAPVRNRLPPLRVFLCCFVTGFWLTGMTDHQRPFGSGIPPDGRHSVSQADRPFKSLAGPSRGLPATLFPHCNSVDSQTHSGILAGNSVVAHCHNTESGFGFPRRPRKIPSTETVTEKRRNVPGRSLGGWARLMLVRLLNLVFGSKNDRELKAFQPAVAAMNALEPSLRSLSDEALTDKTQTFKKRVEAGETLDNILPEAFAACREASRRTIGMRHFDVPACWGHGAARRGKLRK